MGDLLLEFDGEDEDSREAEFVDFVNPYTNPREITADGHPPPSHRSPTR